MADKLIAFLTPLSHFFQKGTHSLSATLGGVAPFWLILGAATILLIIIILSLDKPKALSMLLILYAIGFVLLLIPATSKMLTEDLSEHDAYYAKIALGALPIIAWLVLKYKKRR